MWIISSFRLEGCYIVSFRDETWNVLGLPETVTFSSGAVISYSYAADGTKLRESKTASGTTTTTDYTGNLVLEDGTRSRMLFDGGYVSMSDNAYHFFITDHLGSVRVVASANGVAEEYNHYYPLGGRLPTSTSATGIQPVKYQGKEWAGSKGLNLYDFGARRYDPATGRWLSPDPLGEKYYGHTPYLFCAANPMRYVDPTGQIWDSPEEANALTERINSRIVELRVDNVLSSMLLAMGGLADSESDRLKGTIAYTEERIASLQKSINDISLLGSDPNNTYSLNSVSGGYHYVHLANNGNVLIDASSDAFALHEITHVRQALQAGGLQFNNTGSLINPGEYYYSNKLNRFQNISNMEIEAYRVQHSFDESFYLPIKRLSEINVHSVGNIRDENNNFVYPYIHSLSDYLKRLESISK